MNTDRQKSHRAKKRTYNTRLVKRDYPYFVGEIAELFHLHPNAVRRWLKAGLVSLDDHRPILIHGSDLIDFLDMRQAARKQKCAADELFCLRCRRPRHPRLGRVKLRFRSETRLELSGVCEACGTRMHRAGSAARLEEYRQALSVEMPGEGRITGRSDPSLMCHLSGEKTDAAI
jgi:hypothetical protein